MRSSLLVVTITAGAILLGAVAPVWAQGQPPAVQYKKETRYDFDDDVVEGELQRPDSEFIGESLGTKHSSLIKIRENFVPELLKSAENI